jgi:hypothetical protein
MGIPSFAGIHNQRKAQVLFVLQRYSQIAPGGYGLKANEIAEILNVSMLKACDACRRLSGWKYIAAALTPRGRKQCIYKISGKGSKWLFTLGFLIPWQRYGWTEETIAEIDRKIKEIVDFRGYK